MNLPRQEGKGEEDEDEEEEEEEGGGFFVGLETQNRANEHLAVQNKQKEILA